VSNQSYSEREILLELFPATPQELIPKENRIEIKEIGLLKRELRLNDRFTLELLAIPPSGNPKTHISCDLCKKSAARKFFRAYKIEKPASNGRIFRYYWMCSDLEACKSRRASLNGLEQRGHKLQRSELNVNFAFGGAQIIYKTDDGYIAASDSRKDGQAAGY